MLLQYETQRLILKIIGPDYAKNVLNFYLNDKELFEKYETDRCPNFYTETYQRNTLQAEYTLTLRLQQIRFYVFSKEEPEQIIGTISLYHISNIHSHAEIGYKFSSKYHHKGLASEAVEKMIDIAFTELHLHRLTAHVMESNLPSIRLLEGLGFQKEGVSRDYLYLHGSWKDHIQYSLLAPFSDGRN